MSIRRHHTVGNALNLRHQYPLLARHVDLVEPGPPALLDLPGFGDEPRPGGHRGQVADGHAERDSRLAVGVARSAEGDVRQGEDDPSMRMTLKVDHTGLERQPERRTCSKSAD